MSKLLKYYFPNFCISFTVLTFCAGILNLISGNTRDGFVVFLVEIAGYLVLACGIDRLVGFINFKTYLGHFIGEAVIIYPITMIIAIIAHWFSFNLQNMIGYSILYIVIMICVHIYFYQAEKKTADEINSLLLSGGKKIG